MARETIKTKAIAFFEGNGGKWTAMDIAKAIGHETGIKYNPFDGTCPSVRRVLTQLCKEGLLYQWVTGNGQNPFSVTNVHTYDVNYLRRDSQLAQELLRHPSRTLKGYRIL